MIILQGGLAMLLRFSVENFLSFRNKVDISFVPDGNIKRFSTNIIEEKDVSALRSVGVFGPNNAGKTCLLRSLGMSLAVMEGASLTIMKEWESNWFNPSPVSSFEIEFVVMGHHYRYAFSFDCAAKVFVKENLSRLDETPLTLLSFDDKNCVKSDLGKVVETYLQAISHASPALYSINRQAHPLLEEAYKDFQFFSESTLIFARENFLDDSLTINLLKQGGKEEDKVRAFVRQADLSLDDFYFDQKAIVSKNDPNAPFQNLHSVYHGKDVISNDIDSRGTRKIEAMAGYVITALEKGCLLICDEIDSSLFFKLTRAIVSVFNNSANNGAQLLFTSHDLNVMDTRRLLRKDQIYLTNRSVEGNVRLRRLTEWTARDGLRSEDDVADRLTKEELDDLNLPNPEFLSVLLDINEDGRKG
jgi:hypothetical protein